MFNVVASSAVRRWRNLLNAPRVIRRHVRIAAATSYALSLGAFILPFTLAFTVDRWRMFSTLVVFGCPTFVVFGCLLAGVLVVCSANVTVRSTSRLFVGAIAGAITFALMHVFMAALGMLLSAGNKGAGEFVMVGLATAIIGAVVGGFAAIATTFALVSDGKPTHDDLDRTLAFGGAWTTLMSGVPLSFAALARLEDFQRVPLLIPAGTIAFLGFLAFAVGVARVIRRRAWLARVRRGEVRDVRIRVLEPDEQVPDVAPLMSRERLAHPDAVLEEDCSEVVGGYRRAARLVGRPLALVSSD
jgi:MFS family permease